MASLLHWFATLRLIPPGLRPAERTVRGGARYACLATALALGHLPLDFADGGAVPLLAPIVREAIIPEHPSVGTPSR